MKKRIVILICIFVLIFLIVLTAFILAIRQDLLFIIKEKLSSLNRSADVEKINCDYDELSLNELAELKYVEFNDNLMLINDEFVLASTYAPNIISYNGAQFQEAILESYQSLSDDIFQRFNTPLYVRSAYRTADEQAEIVEDSAANVAAQVGASEHQSGLALDVYVKNYAGAALLECEAGQYLNRGCWQYGFIIRYPHGKTDITGITYEPWHVRYVGAPHSEIIYKESLTLEEYITEFLSLDTFFSFDHYIISRQAGNEGVLKIPKGASEILISPDNTGNYIITAFFQEPTM